MNESKLLSYIERTARAAALIALSMAFAAAYAACGSQDPKIRFDRFDPGLLYYEAPAGTAYRIMGSEDLSDWRYLGTTVARAWSKETPVWFRTMEPQRFFDFQKDPDFSFPDWDDLEDYELTLSFRPLTITPGIFTVTVYTSASPMPLDGSEGTPWGKLSGDIEESQDVDGTIRLSSEPAWEVQMADIEWFQIRIQLESKDGRHSEIVVLKTLSDRVRMRWPQAEERGSKLTVNAAQSDVATGWSLMAPEDEEIPFAE